MVFTQTLLLQQQPLRRKVFAKLSQNWEIQYWESRSPSSSAGRSSKCSIINTAPFWGRCVTKAENKCFCYGSFSSLQQKPKNFLRLDTVNSIKSQYIVWEKSNSTGGLKLFSWNTTQSSYYHVKMAAAEPELWCIFCTKLWPGKNRVSPNSRRLWWNSGHCGWSSTTIALDLLPPLQPLRTDGVYHYYSIETNTSWYTSLSLSHTHTALPLSLLLWTIKNIWWLELLISLNFHAKHYNVNWRKSLQKSRHRQTTKKVPDMYYSHFCGNFLAFEALLRQIDWFPNSNCRSSRRLIGSSRRSVTLLKSIL